MVFSNQGPSSYVVGAVSKFFLMLTFVVRIQSNLFITASLGTDNRGSNREMAVTGHINKTETKQKYRLMMVGSDKVLCPFIINVGFDKHHSSVID